MSIISERVANQYPAFIMTFLSILVGFAIEDVISIIRADARLESLNLVSAVLWSQAAVCIGVAITAWIGFGQITMAKRAVPTPFEIVLIVGFTLLFFWLNSLIGVSAMYKWYFAMAIYSLAGAITTYIVGRFAENEGHQFLAYNRGLRGPIILVLGFAAWFFLIGYLSWRNWLNSSMDILINLSALVGLSLYVWFLNWVWRTKLLSTE